MKTHAERFRHLLEAWGLTQEELGNLCGIKRGTVGTIVNGKTTPDGDALATLLRSKPDLNPDWLLTGTGPMLRDGRALSPAPAPFLAAGEVNQYGATVLKRGALDAQFGGILNEDDGQPRAAKTPTTAQEFIAGLLKENEGLRNELAQLKAENGKLYAVITDQQHNIRTSQEQISVLLGKSYGNQYAPVAYAAEEAPAPIGFGRVRSMYNYATFGASVRRAA